MEQCSPLGWLYYPEEEEMIELKRFLMQTTMELEATIVAAQDEISRKDEELTQMRELFMAAIKERDEAHYQCQKLLVENNSIQQQLQLKKKASLSNEAKDIKSNSTSFTSSDSDESIISSEPPNPKLPPPFSSTLSPSFPPNFPTTLGKERTLPEKGKLLQAVMDAGPLLQTLLLAGPLPQWQNPPPHLDRLDIPLVKILSSPQQTRLLKNQDNSISKRGLDKLDWSVSSSPNCSKYMVV